MGQNPENELISLIAAQIQDDNEILDGLATGRLSVGDLERWRQERWGAEKNFLHETGRLIGEMRAQGFEEQMKTSDARRDSRLARKSSPVGGKRKGAPRAAAAPPPSANGQRRFAVSLADLGLPCTLRVEGTYDEVFDSAVRHARRDHHLHGSEESIREAVRGALVEVQLEREAPEERLGRRSESMVSDEAANMTRGSSQASA